MQYVAPRTSPRNKIICIDRSLRLFASYSLGYAKQISLPQLPAQTTQAPLWHCSVSRSPPYRDLLGQSHPESCRHYTSSPDQRLTHSLALCTRDHPESRAARLLHRAAAARQGALAAAQRPALRLPGAPHSSRREPKPADTLLAAGIKAGDASLVSGGAVSPLPPRLPSDTRCRRPRSWPTATRSASARHRSCVRRSSSGRPRWPGQPVAACILASLGRVRPPYDGPSS